MANINTEIPPIEKCKSVKFAFNYKCFSLKECEEIFKQKTTERASESGIKNIFYIKGCGETASGTRLYMIYGI